MFQQTLMSIPVYAVGLVAYGLNKVFSEISLLLSTAQRALTCFLHIYPVYCLAPGVEQLCVGQNKPGLAGWFKTVTCFLDKIDRKIRDRVKN